MSTQTLDVRITAQGQLGHLDCTITVDTRSGDVSVPAKAIERLESSDARVSDGASRDILGAAAELLERLHRESTDDPLGSDPVRPRLDV